MPVNPFSLSAIGGDIVGADEIIGLDEIVGNDDESLAQLLGVLGDEDDDDFEVGARTKRSLRKKLLAKKRMQALAGLANATVAPNQGRYLYAGGRATQGAAAGALDVQAQVQEAFRPQRLVIQALDNANAAINLNLLEITDILVGTKSQLATIGAVPAGMFGPDATNQMAGFLFDTVQAGTFITVRFRTVAASATIVCGFSGAALR